MSYKQESSYNNNEEEAHFPVHWESVVLSENVSRKIVKYAKRRIDKSKVVEYTAGFESSVDTFVHRQLDLGRLLGKGSFSSVYEITNISAQGYDKQDAKHLVVKVLRPKLALKPSMLAACAADIVFEGMMLSVLHHKNIVSLKAMSSIGVEAFANGRHDAVFLVMERLHDTLTDKIERWQKQSKTLFGSKSKKTAGNLEDRSSAIMQLNSAVQYLHSKRILHRDLKPANIGFDSGNCLKVFDFDVARIVPESDNVDETFLLTKCTGSARYMAPEVALAKTYNLKADVYTFGLLCHEIISLKKPYGNITSGKHTRCVFYENMRPDIPASWPKGFKVFLERSWSPVIEERPTMKEAELILQKELTLMLASTKKSQKKSWKFKGVKTTPINVTA